LTKKDGVIGPGTGRGKDVEFSERSTTLESPEADWKHFPLLNCSSVSTPMTYRKKAVASKWCFIIKIGKRITVNILHKMISVFIRCLTSNIH
jgi:hypothetical protein